LLKTNEFDKELFPLKFIDLLPTICDRCGSETEVSESLTFLQCSNRRCPSKVEYRIFALFRDIGIEEVTIEDCQAFVDKFKVVNPYGVFLYNPKIDGEFNSNYDIEKSNNLYKKINQRRGMLLWEFVKIGNFMYLKDSAERLFGKYDDINTFYNDMETGGIQFIQNLLLEGENVQYTNGEVLIKAVTLYDTLLFFKEDILKGLKGVVLLKPKNTIGIVFASDVSGYSVNYDFIMELNKQYKNEIYFYSTKLLKNSKLRVIYWEDSKNEKVTSQIEKVLLQHPHIKIVNGNTIHDCIKGALSNE